MKLPTQRFPRRPERDVLDSFYASQELERLKEEMLRRKAGRVPEFSRPLIPREEEENISTGSPHKGIIDALMRK